MRIRQFFFLFFSFLVCYSLVFATNEVFDRVVVSVEKQSITHKELDIFYHQINQENASKNLPPLNSEQKAKRVEELISELFFVAAGEAKIEVTPKEIKQAIEDFKTNNAFNEEQFEQLLTVLNVDYNYFEGQFYRKILVEKLIQRDILSKIEIKDKEIKNEYEKNYKKTEKTYYLRHILLKNSLESAKIQLTQIRQTAISKNNFQELAKEFSQDTATAKFGGALPALKKSDMLVEIAEAVGQLKVGEISPLVKTKLGSHLFFLERIATQDSSIPLEQVRQKITRELFTQQYQKDLLEYKKNLQTKFKIVVKDSQLKELLENYANFQF